MRAWVLEEFGGPLVRRDVPVPTIAPYEVLVRVRSVGICGTDLNIHAGHMGLSVLPLIMGQEVAGEVAEVGSQVHGVQPGDRVAVNFYVTCGRCQFCRVGRDTLCADVRQHGFSMDGGFAEYLKTPAVNLCAVPANVPLERACILSDVVATSYHAMTKRAHIRPGQTVAIVGVGGGGCTLCRWPDWPVPGSLLLTSMRPGLNWPQSLVPMRLWTRVRAHFTRPYAGLLTIRGWTLCSNSSPIRRRYHPVTGV